MTRYLLKRSTPSSPVETMDPVRRRRPLSKKGSWMLARVGRPNMVGGGNRPRGVVDPHDLWRDERAGPLSDLNRFPVETHNLLWSDPYEDDLDLTEVDIDELLGGVDDLLGVKSKGKSKKAEAKARPAGSSAKVPASSGKLLPIFEPAFNLREICKQLVLLEDHLFHPKKRCEDCIRKHLLTAEGFAEEAVTLDKKSAYKEHTDGLADKIRAISKMVVQKRPREEIAQSVRVLRKKLSKVSFGALEEGSVASASRLGAQEAPPRQASKGSAVFYAYREGGENAPIEGWYEGTILREGECQGWEIPQEGWMAVDAGEGECLWVKEDEVYPASSSKRKISADLKGEEFDFYTTSGRRRLTLNDKQLRMADLIQSIIVDELGPDFAATTGLSPEAARRAIGSIVPAAIMNAIYESQLDWTVKGDGGNSVGLFQLNSGGAGAGMSVAERQDPITNTRRILEELRHRIAGTKPSWSTKAHPKSSVFANLLARQEGNNPPSVGEWASAWATEVERPRDPAQRATERKASADQIWPAAGSVSLSSPAPAELSPPSPSAFIPKPTSEGAPSLVSAPLPATPPPTASAPAQSVSVRKRTLSEHGLDPKEARAFASAWSSNPKISTAIKSVQVTEEKASRAARERSPAATSELTSAAKQWQKIGVSTRSVWPLARAVALFAAAGAASAAYAARGLIVEGHAGDSWAPTAREEMRSMERTYPRAYLASTKERLDFKPVVLGALAVAGLLGVAAWFSSQR